MGDRLLGFKVMAMSALGAAGSLFAAETGATNVAVGTTLAVVVGFAGLMVQQVLKNQRAVWSIVAEKEAALREAKEETRYAQWERECARFRAGERLEPPPYQPLYVPPAAMEKTR